jgi:hypothetical protein
MQLAATDPLKGKAAPRAEELFAAFSRVAHGAPNDIILQAAFNLIINAIRQKNPRRQGALNEFGNITAKIKDVIANHYSVSGRRLNVFPHHQTIEVPHFDARVKLAG